MTVRGERNDGEGRAVGEPALVRRYVDRGWGCGWIEVGSGAALWIPAFAGMTGGGVDDGWRCGWIEVGSGAALWIPAFAGMTVRGEGNDGEGQAE